MHACMHAYIHTYIQIYITLHYITLHYITLHYIHTYTHPYIHPYIHPSIHPCIHRYIDVYSGVIWQPFLKVPLSPCISVSDKKNTPSYEFDRQEFSLGQFSNIDKRLWKRWISFWIKLLLTNKISTIRRQKSHLGSFRELIWSFKGPAGWAAEPRKSCHIMTRDYFPKWHQFKISVWLKLGRRRWWQALRKDKRENI